MEALIRWENKELGFVSPNQFIPLAERTGFIIKLDEWVVNQVCQQLREWLNKGYEVSQLRLIFQLDTFVLLH